MRCSKHRARKVASRTLPSTAEGSCGYPRGGVDRTPHADLDRDRRPTQRVKGSCSTPCPAASVLAANDPFGAAADLGLEKRCVPQTLQPAVSAFESRRIAPNAVTTGLIGRLQSRKQGRPASASGSDGEASRL